MRGAAAWTRIQPGWVSVEDSARDEESQLEVARWVFGAMMAQGWPVMLSYELQGSLAAYP
jgi:hypothetical protein